MLPGGALLLAGQGRPKMVQELTLRGNKVRLLGTRHRLHLALKESTTGREVLVLGLTGSSGRGRSAHGGAENGVPIVRGRRGSGGGEVEAREERLRIRGGTLLGRGFGTLWGQPQYFLSNQVDSLPEVLQTHGLEALMGLADKLLDLSLMVGQKWIDVILVQ